MNELEKGFDAILIPATTYLYFFVHEQVSIRTYRYLPGYHPRGLSDKWLRGAAASGIDGLNGIRLL